MQYCQNFSFTFPQSQLNQVGRAKNS